MISQDLRNIMKVNKCSISKMSAILGFKARQNLLRRFTDNTIQSELLATMLDIMDYDLVAVPRSGDGESFVLSPSKRSADYSTDES